MSRSRLSPRSISIRPRTRGALASVGILAVCVVAGCASDDADSPASDAADFGGAPAAQSGAFDDGQAQAEEAAGPVGSGVTGPASSARRRWQPNDGRS